MQNSGKNGGAGSNPLNRFSAGVQFDSVFANSQLKSGYATFRRGCSVTGISHKWRCWPLLIFFVNGHAGSNPRKRFSAGSGQ